MVVIALDRAVSPARRDTVQRAVERLLGAGLPNGAGHTEDDRIDAFAGRATERFERPCGVRHEDVRTVDWLRHDGASRACCEGLVDELVPVMDRAGHGDEQEAGLDLPAVESDAGDFERRARRPAGGGRDFAAGPKRTHAARVFV